MNYVVKILSLFYVVFVYPNKNVVFVVFSIIHISHHLQSRLTDSAAFFNVCICSL